MSAGMVRAAVQERAGRGLDHGSRYNDREKGTDFRFNLEISQQDLLMD